MLFSNQGGRAVRRLTLSPHNRTWVEIQWWFLARTRKTCRHCGSTAVNSPSQNLRGCQPVIITPLLAPVGQEVGWVCLCTSSRMWINTVRAATPGNTWCINMLSYLREGEDHTHGPGHSQHDFTFPFGLTDAQGVEDGGLSIQADHNGHKSAGVHRHQLHEHQEPAGDVSRLPLHRDVPRRVHGHHDESHQQVRHSQVHYQDPDVRLAPAAVARSPQYNQVAHGRHRAQDEGDDHPDFGRGGESGQLERVSISAPVARRAGSLAAAIHSLIHQLVEHNEAHAGWDRRRAQMCCSPAAIIPGSPRPASAAGTPGVTARGETDAGITFLYLHLCFYTRNKRHSVVTRLRILTTASL